MAPAQLSTIAEQEAHRNLPKQNLRRHFRPLGMKSPPPVNQISPPRSASTKAPTRRKTHAHTKPPPPFPPSGPKIQLIRNQITPYPKNLTSYCTP